MSLDKEHVFLFEFVIKNMHIPKQYTKKPLNEGTKYRMRVQFGSKIDLSYFIPELDDADIAGEYKGGLSVLLNWSTMDLIGTIYSKPIKITVNGSDTTVLGRNIHFLNPSICKDLLVLSKYPHVNMNSYCGTLDNPLGNTVGVIHVFVRITRLNDITETQLEVKTDQVEYKTGHDRIMTLPLSIDAKYLESSRNKQCPSRRKKSYLNMN